MINFSGTTFTDTDTSFEVKILETGWIQDVYLLISNNIQESIEKRDFNNIQVKLASHSSREKIDGSIYSEFICLASFKTPTNHMEFCFFYSIDGKDYISHPQYFVIV